MPVIRVREATWEVMKTLAKLFEKPDELVSRVIAALAEKISSNVVAAPVPATAQHSINKGRSHQDGSKGRITGQEMRDLIIECLREVGGSAEKRYVERWIEQRLGDRLTPHHWGRVSNEIRWKKRVQFCRNGLREAGLIKEVDAKGIWELAST